MNMCECARVGVCEESQGQHSSSTWPSTIRLQTGGTMTQEVGRIDTSPLLSVVYYKWNER